MTSLTVAFKDQSLSKGHSEIQAALMVFNYAMDAKCKFFLLDNSRMHSSVARMDGDFDLFIKPGLRGAF